MYTSTNPGGKTRKFPKKAPWIALAAVVLVVLIVFLSAFAPFVSVPTGHTGLVTTFGELKNYTFSEGFHLKNPLSKVIAMDNRTQRSSLTMQAFSSDIQQVDLTCSVNYRVEANNCRLVYQTIGLNYYQGVMEPMIMESVKTVFARYSAEKLMEARNVLSDQIMELLVPEMASRGITIEKVSIEDMDFTDAFTDAVEAKQVAEQTRLRVVTEQAQQTAVEQATAERRVIAANAEAEERAILAQAEADVLRIQADAEQYRGDRQAEINLALNASLTPELIQYYQIQQWDGKLPSVYGSGALPILDAGGLLTDPPSAD